MFVFDKSFSQLFSHRYDFHLYIYHCYYLCFVVFRYKSYYELFFHCFNKYFPLCSKKRIIEFVSCFIGSLVVKVIKDRFVTLKMGALRMGVCP